MSKVILYNVYDGDNLVLENARKYEIERYIGKPIPTMEDYAKMGCLLDGKYTVEISDQEFKSKYGITNDQFSEEWTKAVARFKNVIWVKYGGRKLTVKSRR